MTLPGMSSHPVIAALNTDWGALANQPHPWAHPEVASATTFGDLLAAIRAAPDQVLGCLLARHAEGDHRAGRVVLQTMLGKVVLLARADPNHEVGDYVAELWLLIDAYPLARRPRSIAANLALDARKRVRGRLVREVATAPEQLHLPEPDDHVLTVADVLSHAGVLGLIDAITRDCLHAVYECGLRSHQAAEQLGISAAMVRYRTSRGVRRLAAHAALLAG